MVNPAGPPVARYQSWVIAAACHAPRDDDCASVKELKWGVIVDENAEEDKVKSGHVGYCCFTSCEVETPVEGRMCA